MTARLSDINYHVDSCLFPLKSILHSAYYIRTPNLCGWLLRAHVRVLCHVVCCNGPWVLASRWASTLLQACVGPIFSQLASITLYRTGRLPRHSESTPAESVEVVLSDYDAGSESFLHCRVLYIPCVRVSQPTKLCGPRP